MHTGFWCGNLKERGQLEDQRVDYQDNIKTDIAEIKLEGVNWINLAQDTDK